MLNRLGVFINETRKHRGYSLRDLAARSGVSFSTISRIENGEDFQFSHLIGIAEAFNMQVGDMLVAAGYSDSADVQYDAVVALARRALKIGLHSIKSDKE